MLSLSTLNVIAVLEKVATLKRDVASSVNRTAELGALATDEISRLYDLQNASRFVVTNAESAVNIIRKLKAVHLETLTVSLNISFLLPFIHPPMNHKSSTISHQAFISLAAPSISILFISASKSLLCVF